VLGLPRLTVLVSIEADQPGAWFPGPLGQYAALFPGIDLRRDFERVKVPGNPMKSPFCFGVSRGQILAVTISARRLPNHVKNMSSGLCNLQNGTFYLLVSSPGDPRGVRCSHLSIRILPTISCFFALTGISASCVLTRQ
jgi:hypothetical protein